MKNLDPFYGDFDPTMVETPFVLHTENKITMEELISSMPNLVIVKVDEQRVSMKRFRFAQFVLGSKAFSKLELYYASKCHLRKLVMNGRDMGMDFRRNFRQAKDQVFPPDLIWPNRKGGKS